MQEGKRQTVDMDATDLNRAVEPPSASGRDRTSQTVVFVIDQIGGGGAGKVVMRLNRGLRAAGVDSRIVCLHDQQRHSRDPQDDVLFLRSPWMKGPPSIRRAHEARQLASVLKTLAPQGDTTALGAVIAFLPDAHRAAVASGLPMDNIFLSIRTSVQADVEKAFQRSRRKGLRMEGWMHTLYEDRRIIVCSKGIAAELEELGIQPRTLDVIYNPYDKEELQELAGAPVDLPEVPYLVHVGRDHPQKRHDVLIEAMKHVPEPVELFLLGAHGERLHSMIEGSGLSRRVHSIGFQENPYPWIRGARALVSSSDYEGFPNVIAEALMLGTPVVSTDCRTGPSEILTGPLASYLVATGDHQGLADKIGEVLANPPDVRKAPILSQVSTPTIVQKYCDVTGVQAPATYDVDRGTV
jgi:glycosyltransferase involved in cell wall biosynthesis